MTVAEDSAAPGLRSVLLQAATTLLESYGDPRRVTIAAVVAAASCTPPSLYHYWPTREALLREASALGWQEFSRDQMRSDVGIVSPLGQLRARGQAYVGFALDRPSLFRVLFLSHTESAGEPEPALSGLVGIVEVAMDAGDIPAGEPQEVALVLWAAVHGVAALAACNPHLDRGLMVRLGDATIDTVLRGLERRTTERSAGQQPFRGQLQRPV